MYGCAPGIQLGLGVKLLGLVSGLRVEGLKTKGEIEIIRLRGLHFSLLNPKP